jgi:hypothetical protein
MDNQFCKLTDLYMTPDNLWGFCMNCKKYQSVYITVVKMLQKILSQDY